jgi:hypothetical protein
VEAASRAAVHTRNPEVAEWCSRLAAWLGPG